jgi:hypothetical protein
MKTTTPIWTKEDLKIYTLIYCANADFVEDKIETKFIKSKINESDYDKLKAEFDHDNDYESIQKINTAFEFYGYTKEEKDNYFKDIKDLFLSDGNYDHLEKNIFRGLNRILNL